MIAAIGVWLTAAYFRGLESTAINWRDFFILVIPALMLPSAFWLFTYSPPHDSKPEQAPKAVAPAFNRTTVIKTVIEGALAGAVLQVAVAGVVLKLVVGVVSVVAVLMVYWAIDRARE